MYQAASRYYVQDETMESIARALKLSRSSVSRLLKEARESGMVRI
ncbi:sigma factor-like helix-turn-helix DNA-binding protein, partial [Staphylococcus aureus]